LRRGGKKRDTHAERSPISHTARFHTEKRPGGDSGNNSGSSGDSDDDDDDGSGRAMVIAVTGEKLTTMRLRHISHGDSVLRRFFSRRIVDKEGITPILSHEQRIMFACKFRYKFNYVSLNLMADDLYTRKQKTIIY